MKTTGIRVEDLGNRGLFTKERYVVPLWASALGAILLGAPSSGAAWWSGPCGPGSSRSRSWPPS